MGSSSNTPSPSAQPVSYADLMGPDEDWRLLPDATERRKIQNRIAQRAYRRNMRNRTKEVEKLKEEISKLKAKDGQGSSQNGDEASPPHHDDETLHGGVGHIDDMDHAGPLQDVMADHMTLPGQWTHDSAGWSEGMDAGAGLHMDPAFFADPSLLHHDAQGSWPQTRAPSPHHYHSLHARSRSNNLQAPSSAPLHAGGVATGGLPSPPGDMMGLGLGIDNSPHRMRTGREHAPRRSLMAFLDHSSGRFDARPRSSASSVSSGSPGSSPLIPTSAAGYSHADALMMTGSAMGSPLSLATPNGRMPKSDPRAESSLLHLAVAGGHLEVLETLLRRCDIPLDTQDAYGYTPLQRAIIAGRTDMVELLLEVGADVGDDVNWGGVDGRSVAGEE